MRRLMLFMLPLLAFAACNSDDDKDDADTLYAPPTDVAVNAFSLHSDANVLRGLDSVYFSIDLKKAVIYNADSLPKGTNITKLVPNITFSQYITSAIIEMTGGKLRTGTVDYRKTPGDSIDFSGKVTLKLTSSSGNSRVYELKVNVHEQEPDLLSWGQTALSKLPSRMASPVAQRTVRKGDEIVSMIQERDGSYTVATTTHPERMDWVKTQVSVPFVPNLRTLAATPEMLYMLDNSGTVCCSRDGVSWEATSARWENIIGAYGSNIIGLRRDGSDMIITSLDGSVPEHILSGDLAGFPVEDYSNLYCYQSKWMQAPIAVLMGGIDSRGEVSDRVWGFDGNSWIVLSAGEMPALRCATLIPYFSYLKASGVWVYNEYSTLIAVGGMTSEGELNHDLYVSYDNGVSFRKGSDLMQLPEYIPGMWECDGIVSSIPMEGSIAVPAWTNMPDAKLSPWYRVQTVVEGTTVKWDCPYIYIFGGADADGQLYDTVWRGVINRLKFVPVI